MSFECQYILLEKCRENLESANKTKKVFGWFFMCSTYIVMLWKTSCNFMYILCWH